MKFLASHPVARERVRGRRGKTGKVGFAGHGGVGLFEAHRLVQGRLTQAVGRVEVPKAVAQLGFGSILGREPCPGIEVLHPGLRFFSFVFVSFFFFSPTL